MSTYSADALVEAFNGAAKEQSFNKKYQAQADALAKIVKAINAEGTFTAQIKPDDRFGAQLEIRHKGGITQSFSIGFGQEAFSGSKTIKLAAIPDGRPVGNKKEGYCLDYEPDYERFMKELGTELARGYAAAKAGAELVRHVNGKKP